MLVVALAAVIAGALWATNSEPPPPPPRPDIPLDAWVPYWTLDSAMAETDRLGSMRDVSPFWFNAVGVDQIVIDPNADADLTTSFMDEAKGSTANVVPSIVDAMPAGGMAALLADPTSRTAHVDAIARFAADGDFDGIDIDYEQFAYRRRSGDLGRHSTELGGVHHRTRRPPPRRWSHPDREHPADL